MVPIMSNFKRDILEAVGDEIIEAVVVGEFGWGGYSEDDRHEKATARRGEILTWDEAAPLLDYDYSTGYGAPDCHAVRIWTNERIYWVTQYDGSTSIDSTNRNPVACVPDMPGG